MTPVTCMVVPRCCSAGGCCAAPAPNPGGHALGLLRQRLPAQGGQRRHVSITGALKRPHLCKNCDASVVACSNLLSPMPCASSVVVRNCGQVHAIHLSAAPPVAHTWKGMLPSASSCTTWPISLRYSSVHWSHGSPASGAAAITSPAKVRCSLGGRQPMPGYDSQSKNKC
jgi:hypothetical protein